jgi:hypothetical protein
MANKRPAVPLLVFPSRLRAAGVISLLALLLASCHSAGRANPTISPTTASEARSSPESIQDAVRGLKDPPFSSTSGLSPDAVRIFDIMALQASLLSYRIAEGSYPPSIEALFPTYSPIDSSGKPHVDPPVDPITHAKYQYAPVSGGREYEIGTVLSNGSRFEGFPHHSPS